MSCSLRTTCLRPCVLDLVLTVTSLPVSPLLTSNSTDIFFFVCHLSPKISLNGTTPEHLRWKWLTTVSLRLKNLPHFPQQNSLTSKCLSLWCFNSVAVQKHFRHSLQTYGFTPSWRRICVLRWPLRVNFFWQMWHVNQVPSLCDFSRCDLSWSGLEQCSEQCLHEYGFAPVWVRTCFFRSRLHLNSFPQ